MSANNQAPDLIDWPTILRAHGPAVWKTIYRLVGGNDAARDCYQETFLAALQAARRQRVQNWGGFLQALATRRAIDCLRQRYLQKPLLHLTDDSEDAVDPVPLAMQQLEQADLCERVRGLLSSLPPRQAQAFWLRYMEQLPISQIAEQLETAPANVSVLLNRASAHLKQALQRTESPRQYGEAHA